ncbi:MAG: hypothetical protein RI955_811 [Bacteroidota bacterium]
MRQLFFTFFVLFSFSAFAQQEFEIGLASGKFIPKVALKNNFISKKQFRTTKSFNGKKYFIIQFNQLPNAEQHQQLKKMGIQLLGYLPKNAYYVSVSAKSSNKIFNSFSSIRAVVILNDEIKIRQEIKKYDVPAYVQEGENYKLMITVYENIDINTTIETLNNTGASVIHVFNNDHHLSVKINMHDVNKIAQLPFVQFIDFINDIPKSENLENKTLHRSNVLSTDYGAGRKYDGTGVHVALTDDGIIGPHIDYKGRDNQSNVNVDNGNHGDHCAGIIGGAGNLSPLGKGMAPDAKIWVYNVSSIGASYVMDDTIYTSPFASIDIVSTSYSDGCNTGYNAGANSADRQMRTFTNAMRVFSAGNQGTADCNFGAGAGWGNITGGIKAGKNVIAVANTDLHDVINYSSSRGPATDGRIKPDVAAQGTDVFSSVAPYSYDVYTGTSMACPGVSGVLAQLYQAYRNINSNQDPNMGLMKGVLMNSADDIGNAGPDFIYGYGRMNGNRAVKVLEQHQYTTDSVANGITKTTTLNIPANIQLAKIMLIWLDKEATVGVTTALVNDLDLKITSPSATIIYPWILNPAANATTLNALATQGVDHLNNVEQITIANPVSGNYTIDVTGFAVTTANPQSYFIVYEFIENNQLELTYPIGGENITAGSTQVIRWDAIDNNFTFDVDYSTNGGASFSNIASSIPSNQTYYDWNVPSITNGNCRIRITRNSISDTSIANFSIMDTVSNLSVDYVCTDTLKLSWNAVANATSYDIYRLGVKYMDSITTITNTFIKLGGAYYLSENWFSVVARGINNAISRRCYAVRQYQGISNCSIPYDAVAALSTQPGNMDMQSCNYNNTLPVNITINNIGKNSISNFPVKYAIDNQSAVIETFSSTILKGNSAIHNFATQIGVLAAGNHQLKIWVDEPNDGNRLNDTLKFTINILNSTLHTLPWNDDFETFTLCPNVFFCDTTHCPLINDFINEQNGTSDDADWKVFSGSTPTAASGPDFDYNPGTATGKYLYIEASYCNNLTAKIITPCFDLRNTIKPVFGFMYHLYGAQMGSLYVDAYYNNLWHNDIVLPLTGDKGNQWLLQEFDASQLNGNIVNFRLRGITGNGSASDMAIDDLTMRDTAWNIGSPIVIHDKKILIYPNANNGKFVVDLSSNQSEINSIEIVSTSGILLKKYTKPMFNQPLSINISEFESAIYLLKINTAEGQSFVSKITKI